MEILKLETKYKKWEENNREGDFPYTWEDILNVAKIQWAKGKDPNAVRYMNLAFEFGFNRGYKMGITSER